METTSNNRPMLIDGLSCVCGYNKIYYYRLNVDGISDVNQLACPNCGIIMRSPNTDENGEWLKKHWKKTHETRWPSAMNTNAEQKRRIYANGSFSASSPQSGMEKMRTFGKTMGWFTAAFPAST